MIRFPQPRQSQVGRPATSAVKTGELPEDVRAVQVGYRRLMVAITIATVSIGVAGCSGNTDADGSNALSGGGAPQQAADQPILFGKECVQAPDLYQEGLLHIADGKGGIVPERLADLEHNITLQDGLSGRKSPKITNFPAEILEQIRASIDKGMAEGALAPGLVNLYGERQPDWDDYDGELNNGLRACVA